MHAPVISQSEIASRLGVSQRTVSVALNGKPGVTEATRRRVLEAARHMGYRPNAAARSMRVRRFRAAAMLTRPDVSALQLGLDNGIDEALARHGYNMLRATIAQDTLAETDRAPRLLRELSVDGLIIHYAHQISEKEIEQVASYRLPAIWANTQNAFNSAYPDDLSGAETATRHFLETGHARVAFFSCLDIEEDDPRAHYSNRDRRVGYERAMTQAGRTPRVVRRATDCTVSKIDASAPDRIEAAKALLTGPDRATAVVARGEIEAVALALAAASTDLAMDRDIQVVTFSSQIETYGLGLRIARVPMYEVGEAAVEMLLACLRNDGKPVPSRKVPYGEVRPPSV